MTDVDMNHSFRIEFSLVFFFSHFLPKACLISHVRQIPVSMCPRSCNTHHSSYTHGKSRIYVHHRNHGTSTAYSSTFITGTYTYLKDEYDVRTYSRTGTISTKSSTGTIAILCVVVFCITDCYNANTTQQCYSAHTAGVVMYCD